MVVISPDLRNHPVGRFWSPIVRSLYEKYIVSHIALNSSPLYSDDSVRSFLKSNSHNWIDIESNDKPIEPAFNLSLTY